MAHSHTQGHLASQQQDWGLGALSKYSTFTQQILTLLSAYYTPGLFQALKTQQ